MRGRAIVAGGGIGGLSAALAIRRIGMEVTVYERVETLAEVGAGLTLWPNALHALRRIDLEHRVREAGARIERAEIRTATGRVLAHSEPGALERRFGAPTVAIHRADLHALLREALPSGTLVLGRACDGFEQDADGITVHFEDGSTDRADVLIAADGIHSNLRRRILPSTRPRYAGYTAWRGVVSTPEASRPGRTTESWGRGARFGIVPIGSDRVYWFATANVPSGRSASDHKQTLLNRFGDWHAPIGTLLRSTPDEAILQNDIYDLPPLERWGTGRMTLLGDAAHATTPNMGQGACMAIESAVVLARCLAEAPDLIAGLRQYEAERKPRTTWITRQSRHIGRIGQLEHPVACGLRDLAIRLTPSFVMHRTLARAVGFAPAPLPVAE